MNADKLKALRMDPSLRERPQRPIWIIFISVILLTGAAIYFARPKAEDQRRIKVTSVKPPTNTPPQRAAAAAQLSSNAPPASSDGAGPVLTVSGYIVNRERIELSPRFMGVVNWIGVRKGDMVTNGQIVVLLDDAEYKARLHESAGHLAGTKAALTRAEHDLERVSRLPLIESEKSQDDARLLVEAARADLQQAEGAYELAKTYLDWTVIRSPINGVVLEKLVDPNELVVPQSFGGTRGPSTALIALADPKDLQVEIDMNEADLSKVSLGQTCRVSPEAYPDKVYPGRVVEIAPEANRSKGTLQIKVQILNPDHYLTPELSAKVEFLQNPHRQ